MKYRKKPMVIEAVKYTGENGKEIISFCGSCYKGVGGLYIKTLEGVMKAAPGDFVIKGVNGEFYPCKPDIFMKTYEEVAE
jgi:hypothetical protein